MLPARLALVLDDIELGTAITHLAELYFQSGDRTMGAETLAEAERCYISAVRSSAGLTLEDSRRTEQPLQTLRVALLQLGFVKRAKALPSTTLTTLGLPIFFGTI